MLVFAFHTAVLVGGLLIVFAPFWVPELRCYLSESGRLEKRADKCERAASKLYDRSRECEKLMERYADRGQEFEATVLRAELAAHQRKRDRLWEDAEMYRRAIDDIEYRRLTS